MREQSSESKRSYWAVPDPKGSDSRRNGIDDLERGIAISCSSRSFEGEIRQIDARPQKFDRLVRNVIVPLTDVPGSLQRFRVDNER